MAMQPSKVPIGSVTSWLSGGTPNRGRSEYWNGSIPWISAFTLKDPEISTSNQFVTAEAVAAGSKMAPVGSTLLLVRGSALHNEIRAGMVAAPVAFNQDVKALVPKRGMVPKYLTHVIRANESELLKLVTSAGNTAGVLDTRVVQAFEIFVPDKAEQSRLVEAFDDADSHIAALDRLIAKKQAMNQGMMQQLVTGMTRIPGFDDPWRNVQVCDLLEFKNGLNKGSEFFGTGTPIVNFMDVMNGLIIASKDVTGRVTLTKDEIKRFSAQRGDLFFTRTSETVEEVGTAAVLIDDIPDACFSGFILRGRPRSSGIDSRFLARAFQLDGVHAQVVSSATYTTRALTNGRSLGRVTISVPGVDEQHAIAEVFDDADAEIAALRARLTKLRAIKAGMMQELLTGHIQLTRQAMQLGKIERR